ncbi:MAG: hypothetical protein ACE5Q6_21560 [Dehalococcoidia bacterium]
MDQSRGEVMPRLPARLIGEPVHRESLGFATAEVYRNREGAYSVLLTGDRLVLFLGTLESLEGGLATIQSLKERIASSGVALLRDLISGRVEDPAHAETLGRARAQVYQDQDGRYCLFVIGERLAFFLGSYPSLEDCRSAISDLQELRSLLGSAFDAEGYGEYGSSS